MKDGETLIEKTETAGNSVAFGAIELPAVL